MGYTTEFEGSISIDPPLNPGEVSFLNAFSDSRRMKREKGPLFVGGTGFKGQGSDADVIDHNNSPEDQPGLWCQWIVSEYGDEIYWNGTEKFYSADEWMKYIVENLLAESARPYINAHKDEDWRLANFTCDHVLNGTIEAQGEEAEDQWRLIVEDNVVKVARVRLTWEDAKEI